MGERRREMMEPTLIKQRNEFNRYGWWLEWRTEGGELVQENLKTEDEETAVKMQRNIEKRLGVSSGPSVAEQLLMEQEKQRAKLEKKKRDEAEVQERWKKTMGQEEEVPREPENPALVSAPHPVISSGGKGAGLCINCGVCRVARGKRVEAIRARVLSLCRGCFRVPDIRQQREKYLGNTCSMCGKREIAHGRSNRLYRLLRLCSACGINSASNKRWRRELGLRPGGHIFRHKGVKVRAVGQARLGGSGEVPRCQHCGERPVMQGESRDTKRAQRYGLCNTCFRVSRIRRTRAQELSSEKPKSCTRPDSQGSLPPEGDVVSLNALAERLNRDSSTIHDAVRREGFKPRLQRLPGHRGQSLLTLPREEAERFLALWKEQGGSKPSTWQGQGRKRQRQPKVCLKNAPDKLCSSCGERKISQGKTRDPREARSKGLCLLCYWVAKRTRAHHSGSSGERKPENVLLRDSGNSLQLESSGVAESGVGFFYVSRPWPSRVPHRVKLGFTPDASLSLVAYREMNLRPKWFTFGPAAASGVRLRWPR